MKAFDAETVRRRIRDAERRAQRLQELAWVADAAALIFAVLAGIALSALAAGFTPP